MTKPTERSSSLNAPVEYVARPKPYTAEEHQVRRIEEVRCALENMRAERRAIDRRILAAEASLKILEGK